MKTALMIAMAAAALTVALPALADGYGKAPPASSGPAPLEAHAPKDTRIEIVKVVREAPSAACVTTCCSCGPVSYGRTYSTAPVVIERYTRTYTREAPPSCGHRDHAGYDHHSHEARFHGAPARTGYVSAEPAYQEGTVIWSSDGRGAAPSAPESYVRYSYVPPHHDDRGGAWSHYDHDWKSRTNDR